jgi:PAS domain S-box-containing protein
MVQALHGGTRRLPMSAAVTRSLTAEHALDCMTDGVVALDRDFRYVFVNRAAQRLLDVHPSELVGHVIWDVYPGLVGTRVETELRHALDTGESSEFELFAPVLKRWVAYKAFGSADGVALYFYDVTARRSAEDRLRASEARWRLFFENSLDGQILATPDGGVLAANAAARAAFARTEDELKKATRADLIDMRDERTRAVMEQRERSGRARGVQTYVRADGSTFPAEVSSAVFVDADGHERVSLSFRDVSARERAKEAARLTADAIALLATSLDTSTTLQHLTRLIVPTLADFCIVDLLQGGVVTRVAVTHADPERAQVVAAVRSVAPNRETPHGVNYVMRTGDSELVPAVTDEWLRDATGSPEHLAAARATGVRSMIMVPLVASGRRIGVLSVGVSKGARRYDAADLQLAQALADRAALAIENARLYKAAVDASRLREAALGAVSHDLRTPLNAIALMAQVIARHEGVAEEVATIRDAVARANRLIADLLTASQAEAGALRMDSAPTDMAEIVADVVRLHRPAAHEKRLSLAAEVAALPTVNADRHRVTQVLSNLLGNAIKFTPPEGRVTVAAESIAGALRVSVVDTGPGIPAEMVPHVFDRFWQEAHARHAGVGLGLSIAKGIIDAHGGRIWVETEAGSGAAFRFTLPLETTDSGR